MGHRNEILVLFLPHTDKEDTILESALPFPPCFFLSSIEPSRKDSYWRSKLSEQDFFFSQTNSVLKRPGRIKQTLSYWAVHPLYPNFNQIWPSPTPLPPHTLLPSAAAHLLQSSTSFFRRQAHFTKARWNPNVLWKLQQVRHMGNNKN